MGDSALPYIFPKIENETLETLKFVNLLSAMRSRRRRSASISHKPIDATIDLTTTCQLQCPYCAVGNGTMERPVALMKQERYQHILSSIGEEVLIIWYFSTGEPLLHKHFSELVSTSKDKRIFSAISTNLSLPLSDKKIEDLLLSGLGMISVSLDGATEETYKRYRVGGKYDLVLQNMRRLIERKKEMGLEYPLIEWRFLRFRHNQHEEEKARRLAADLGVDLLEFFPGYAPHDAGDDSVQAANVPMRGPGTQGSALSKFTNRPRGTLDAHLVGENPTFGMPAARTRERKCDWLYFGTMIYPDGAVGPCCVANDKKDDFCNVDDFPGFTEAWNSPKFQSARNLFVDGTRSNTICDACPMPSAQHYQFGQKIRSFLRVAPDWALKILDARPEEFFFEIDQLLMPQEVGSLVSGSFGKKHSGLRSGRFPEVAKDIFSFDIDAETKKWITDLLN